MSKMMVKRDGLWTPMVNLKGDTGPLPADNSVTNDALVTDGAKTNTAYLMGNRLTATAEGEMISVDDSYPSAALSLTVDGKSTQVTTTGKNLIPTTMPSNAIHATISGSGSDTSGTLASAGSAWVYAIPCERNTQYVYQASRNGAIGGIGLSNTDSLHVNDTVWKVATITYMSSRTFSSGEYDYILLQNSNTAEFNNMPANKVMLSVGSSITDYEPYTEGKPSPCPEYPQEIVDMTDSVATFARKNLLNPMNIESGYITGYGDSANSQQCRMAAKIQVTPGAKYVASFSNSIRYVAYFYTNWNDNIRTAVSATLSSGAPFAVPTRCNYVRLTFGTPVGTLQDAQLELGSTATEYEPYLGNIASLLPEGTSLRSLPDGTKDELYLTYLRPSSREGWAWYSIELVQRVRVMTLDGSETWGKDRFGFYHRMDNLATAAGDYSKSLLCDCLAAYRQYPELAGKAGMSGYRLSATGANWLYINVEGISTISDFQAWLAESVPAILHETTEQPITTHLDPIELPIMQAGITNIWTDPSTSLSVTYERDRNIVISKLEAAAADLATS